MKINGFLAASVLVIAASVMSGAARASMVVYDAPSVVQGQEAYSQSFSVTTPGTLTFSVSSVSWLDVVADLNCFLSTATGLVGTRMGLGTETYNIGPGTYYAHWMGDARGAYNEGILGIKLQFQPATAVPLPASLLLMLSGLGLLFGWQWMGRRVDRL